MVAILGPEALIYKYLVCPLGHVVSNKYYNPIVLQGYIQSPVAGGEVDGKEGKARMHKAS